MTSTVQEELHPHSHGQIFLRKAYIATDKSGKGNMVNWPKSAFKRRFLSGKTNMTEKADMTEEATPELRWSSTQVLGQEQSVLAGQLPGEIRNLIYSFVWGDSGLEPFARKNTPAAGRDSQRHASSQPAHRGHPLALLLTCRKINLEATSLAFSLNTFVISRNYKLPTYLSFHQLIAPLPASRVHFLSHLAYDAGTIPCCYHGIHSPTIATDAHPYDTTHLSPVVTHALVLFPALSRLALCVDAHARAHCGHCPHNDGFLEPPRRARVPQWFLRTVAVALNGRMYAWQKGERWSAVWPQEERGGAVVQDVYGLLGVEGVVGLGEALVGMEECGIEVCACGCGQPSWVVVELVQETGRRVRVGLVHYEKGEEEGEGAEGGRDPVREMVRMEGVRVRCEGFGGRGGKEFWKGFRENNKGAVARAWDQGVGWVRWGKRKREAGSRRR